MARGTKVEYIRFVDGSAARKFETAPIPFQKANLPKKTPAKRRCIYIDPVAMFGIFVAVCMFIMLAVGIGKFAVQKNKVQQMEAYLQQLEAEGGHGHA